MKDFQNLRHSPVVNKQNCARMLLVAYLLASVTTPRFFVNSIAYLLHKSIQQRQCPVYKSFSIELCKEFQALSLNYLYIIL